MAIKTVWTCDGCDAHVEMNEEGETPQGWGIVAVEITGMALAERNQDEEYQLCDICQRSLQTKVMPLGWPRPPIVRQTRLEE